MTRRALASFSAGLALALALGWVGFPRLLFARAEQPLRFSHRTHASDKTGFGCADCHPIGEDGRFAGSRASTTAPAATPSRRARRRRRSGSSRST